MHIIYVTPIDLEHDLKPYYEQMLNMRTSVESGTPEVIENLQDRVTFVYPENAIKFRVCIVNRITFDGNGSKLHEGTKLHEVTKLHESKKKYRKKNTEKKLKKKKY